MATEGKATGERATEGRATGERATEGIGAVFLETHNWGQAARFFQDLGFTLEFDTGHSSGQLRNGDGPYVFIAEVPQDRPPRAQMVLTVADEQAYRPGPGTEVVTQWTDTHYGTREMTIRDPDGRTWILQATPEKAMPGKGAHGKAEPEKATPGKEAPGKGALAT